MSKQPSTTHEVPSDTSTPLINFRVPDDAFGRYATHVAVQIGENEYFVTFFEVKPPFILTPNDPFPDKVNADYLCRVIIAKSKLPEVIEVLSRAAAREIERANSDE